MKNNLKKSVVALTFLCGLFLIPTTTQAEMCSGCGDYQIIGGQTVFYCGNNGNTNCLYECRKE